MRNSMGGGKLGKPSLMKYGQWMRYRSKYSSYKQWQTGEGAACMLAPPS